jgi:hypothetical protein
LLRRWDHPALDLFTFSVGAPEYARVFRGDMAGAIANLKARCAHLARVRNVVIDRAMTHTD